MKPDNNKVVLITGASRGLGRSLALGFGGFGYRVGVHYKSRADAGEEVVREIHAREGEALALAADLSDAVQVEKMVRRLVERWGGVDILINNGAVIQDNPVVSMSETDWDAVLGVNLSGPFFVMRAVYGSMRTRGGGQIVNILSLSGVRGSAGQANYASAKAGLIGLSRAAAREWGPDNIRVNAVSPGFMETDMTQTVPGHVKARALKQSCLNRFCDPEDVVGFVKTLVKLRGVTGQVYHLDSRIP